MRLENYRGFTPSVGSNPTLSASLHVLHLVRWDENPRSNGQQGSTASRSGAGRRRARRAGDPERERGTSGAAASNPTLSASLKSNHPVRWDEPRPGGRVRQIDTLKNSMCRFAASFRRALSVR